MTRTANSKRADTAHAAVGYLRCSTDKQPLSLEDQRRAIVRWAEERGIKILRWYVDDAISGASAADREGFQSMIREVEERRDVSKVLCYDVSRFGRTDTDEAGFYRFRLRQAGAEVVYVAETAVNGSETDDLLLPVLQYQKREYLRSLSRDTLRGLIGLAKKGAWCGGPAPFGYVRELRTRDGVPVRRLAPGERATTEDGSFVHLVPGDPRDIEAVRLAWELYHVQGAGFDTIRDKFTEMGVRPPRGPAWRMTSVRAIVLNPVYLGRISYGLRTKAKFHCVSGEGAVARPRTASGKFEVGREPVVLEGAHPPLVSEAAAEAFRRWEEQTRARREAGTAHTRRNQHVYRAPYLLSGLLKCGRCGYTFHGSTRRRKGHAYEDYICSGYEGSGKAICQRLLVRREDLENLVVGELQRRWTGVTDVEALRARVVSELQQVVGPGEDAPLAELRREIARVDARMFAVVKSVDPEHGDVVNAVLAGLKAERASLLERMRALEDRERLNEQIEDVADDVAAFVISFRSIWEKASLIERKALLACFVKEIVIDPRDRSVELVLYAVPKTQPAPVRCSREPVTSASGSGGGI